VALLRGTITRAGAAVDDRFKFINEWPAWRRDNFADFVRTQGLGAQLWGGGKVESLQRQLELPSPKIPPGLGRQELLALEKHARMMLASANDRWAPKYLSNVVTVGGDEYTVGEAMYEIVRRALGALDN
jgi:hypothetical protein